MPRKHITEATLLRDRWTKTKRANKRYRAEITKLKRQVKRQAKSLKAWRDIAIACGGFHLRKGTR